MMPDVARAQRGGLVAMLAALAAALGMAWYAWMDQPVIDARLEAAQEAARKIGGKQPLRDRVDRQRQANADLARNIAELKTGTGFVPSLRYTVPPGEHEPGKWFLNRFVEVRQQLRDKADARRIERDERLGFPPDDKVPPDADAPELLAMLQLTEQALGVVLAAPDPVERFDISHGRPEETGPVDRPPLLKEYPITLKVRGSLKTILWMLHRYGEHADGDCPLILRGLSIRSGNSHARDDVQQLEATFELAAMAFIPDEVRSPATAKAAGAATVHKARP